ncbi:unnamed protein product [Symbiodinium sp. CCMP2592]|nr:unnamed protein product [Symbiodinium sp. CCMP2592]
MSDSRAKGLHYTVKDRRSGYACLICGLAGDIRMIRSEECLPGKVPESKMAMSPTTKGIMQQTQIEADEKIALEMARELEQLQAEAVELEQMKILQDLEMEELELQGLLQQQKALALQQAAASAGLIVPKDDKVSRAPTGMGVLATAAVSAEAPNLESPEVRATAAVHSEVKAATAANPEVKAATAVIPEVRATTARNPDEVLATKAVNPDEVLATTAVNPEVPATVAVNPEVLATAAVNPEVSATAAVSPEVPAKAAVNPEVLATAAVNPEVQACAAKVELGAAPASTAIACIDNLETQPMELAPIAATMVDVPKVEDSAVPLAEPGSGKDEAEDAPSTCPVKRLPAITPADQSKMAGVAPKKRARAKKAVGEDGAVEGEVGAVREAVRVAVEVGQRVRVVAVAVESSKRGHEDGETGAPSKKKANQKDAEEKPATKPKAKGKAKAKAKAVATPKAGAKSKKAPMEDEENGPAKEPVENSKANKKGPSDEEKKRRSRKSVAYHKAKVTTLREGGTPEEAVAAAKAATKMQYRMIMTMPTCISRYRLNPAWMTDDSFVEPVFWSCLCRVLACNACPGDTMLSDFGCLVAHLALLPKQKAGEFAPTFKVLLIRWMTNMAIQPRFQLFDLFCGQGNLSKYWKEAGYPVASYDKLFGPSMDMLTNSGFVHIDKSGKSRFTGKSQELKQSGFRDLRVRRKVHGLLTDRELFEGMPLSDTWMDSGIHEVILYLYKSSYLKIPDSWLSVMDKFIEELKNCACGTASLREELRQAEQEARQPSTLLDPPAVPGAPATALSLTEDVAGKSIRNLGSFKASSEDAQRDPLYHADSNATLVLPGPKSPETSPKPLITVEPTKTPKKERGRSRHHHSHRRKRHGDRSSCKKKLLVSPVPPSKSKTDPPSDDASSDGVTSKCSTVRLRRYFQPRSNGNLKCSKEALELYSTEPPIIRDHEQQQGKKLHQILKDKGDFKLLEMAVKKVHRKMFGQTKSGGWYTKHALQNQFHWQMIAAAWQWASAHGNLRVNEVHKEEEARLVLSDNFELLDESGQEITMSGTLEMEDESGFLMEDDLPSMSGPTAAILSHPASSSDGHENVVSGQAASFKMVFPTLAQNASPVSILASFIDVCGRKMDQSDEVLDRLESCILLVCRVFDQDKLLKLGNDRATALHDQIKNMVDELKLAYKALTLKQADSVVTVPDQAFNNELLRIYADITKKDVLLNNFILRARPMVKAVKPSKNKAPAASKAKDGKKDKKSKKEKKEKKTDPKGGPKSKKAKTEA